VVFALDAMPDGMVSKMLCNQSLRHVDAVAIRVRCAWYCRTNWRRGKIDSATGSENRV
jgi:hypothetical protein